MLLVSSYFKDIQYKLSLKENDEGNVFFSDALNTFHLRLYGVRYKVKDHSDNERGT